jgi:hypothetical protein
MTLRELAKATPSARVRLYFADSSGNKGYLETTAARAAAPNASMRFFPPQNADGSYASPADMGWPVPYWYASEVVRCEVIS